MAAISNGLFREAYTFDDVLLKPGLSEVMPSEVDIRSRITRNIVLNIPIVASAMDTVSESAMAIAMAQAGGIGVIHRNLEPDAQAAQVRQVKKFESGMVVNPVTIHPDATLAEALASDAGKSHFRHSRGRRRRQRPEQGARQARRHPHQSRRPLCHRYAAESFRADDQGEAGHGARERRPGRSQEASASASDRKASGRRRAISLRRPHHRQGYRKGGGQSPCLQGRAGPAARRSGDLGRAKPAMCAAKR